MKLLLALAALLLPQAAAAGNCIILTSSPERLSARLLYADSLLQAIPTVRLKPETKFVPFTAAYDEFFDNVTANIQKQCDDGKIGGIVNLKVQHSVVEHWYHFTATFDYIK